MDCFDTDEPHELTVVLELPGIDPDSDRGRRRRALAPVAGERERPRVDGQVYQQMEIEYGLFERVLKLTEDVDVDAATASYDRGMLP